MLPHPKGEAASIAHAFLDCSLGLHELDRSKLDQDATDFVTELERLMSTAGLDDLDDVGTYTVRAEQLTLEQRFALARVVDELASWCDRHSP
jgi:hypothetical protein